MFNFNIQVKMIQNIIHSAYQCPYLPFPGMLVAAVSKCFPVIL